MANYTYAFKGYDKESMARAVGMNMPISHKSAIEICNYVKGKKLQRVKEVLQQVIKKKVAIPYKRFTGGAGHRHGIGSGKYPVKASQNILAVLENAEINAQQKGLNTANLIIRHISSQGGSRQPHYGRHRGRKFKRTHVEVMLAEEGSGKTRAAEEGKNEPPKQLEKKTEVKPVQARPETKPRVQENKQPKQEIKND